MDMYLMGLVKVVRNIVFIADRAHICQSRFGRLFHDVSQLTGQPQAAFSGHDIHFDLKGLPSVPCPGKPGNYADLIFLVDILIRDLLFAEKICDVIHGYAYAVNALLKDLPRRLSAEVAYAAF